MIGKQEWNELYMDNILRDVICVYLFVYDLWFIEKQQIKGNESDVYCQTYFFFHMCVFFLSAVWCWEWQTQDSFHSFDIAYVNRFLLFALKWNKQQRLTIPNRLRLCVFSWISLFSLFLFLMFKIVSLLICINAPNIRNTNMTLNNIIQSGQSHVKNWQNK